MTDTAERNTSGSDIVAEVKDWLAANWDPDLPVAEWWERLGTSGWGVPTWPSDWFGKDLSRDDGNRVQQAIADFGALPAPGGLGLMLAGPTILVHGTDEQKQRYLRDIVTGQRGWCQLFSEPGAGSDLAGLQCRAEQDGEEWVVNGQKVWTSGGQVADLGMLIARTDPDRPKHAGHHLLRHRHAPGRHRRPPAAGDDGPGAVQRGVPHRARVARRRRHRRPQRRLARSRTPPSCSSARASAPAGAAPASLASPGTVGRRPRQRAGDFVTSGGRRGGGGGTLFGASPRASPARQANGSVSDPSVRQRLMQLHTFGEVARFNNLRLKAAKAAGGDIPGLPNIAKLSMSNIVRHSRDLGSRSSAPTARCMATTPAPARHSTRRPACRS